MTLPAVSGQPKVKESAPDDRDDDECTKAAQDYTDVTLASEDNDDNYNNLTCINLYTCFTLFSWLTRFN